MAFKIMKKQLKIIILASIFFLPNYVLAQYNHKNFNTKAFIEQNCKISMSDINFGTLAAPLTIKNSHNHMNILCSNGLPYTVDLYYGKNTLQINEPLGHMTGIDKQDVLYYKITIPGQPSLTWRKNVNAYTSIGSGKTQSILVNAIILNSTFNNFFISEDFYLDNIIAEFSY